MVDRTPVLRSGWTRVVAAVFEFVVRLLRRGYVQLSVVGAEHLPARGGYVLVANHNSHLDAVVLMAAGGGRFDRYVFAAAGDYFFEGPGVTAGASAAALRRSPWVGLLRAALRLEPLPRRVGQDPARRAALDRAFARLRHAPADGSVVVYFPEGTRSHDGRIGAFRPGVDDLCRGLEVPVVPVHIAGTHQLWPRGRRWLRRGAVTVTIGEPIAIDGATDTDGLAGRLEADVRLLGGVAAGSADTATGPLPHMKWWGWGDHDVSFRHDDKPALPGFVRTHLGVDLDGPVVAPVPLDEVQLAPPVVSAELRADLAKVLRPGQIAEDRLERVLHAFGKSVTDLVRLRRGDAGRAPDLVVYPHDEDDVVEIMRVAHDHDVVVIPFGGGSNISESLEPPLGERRTVISLDLRRLDRVLSIDVAGRTARIQAGASGPALEAQLNAVGWTLGHFPDSFRHSTLGGWIATRSSGMQSDTYGDISHMTLALRAVTPLGVLATRAVPSKSTGPDVNQMLLGSEGRLGVITEATMRIHRLPEERLVLGYVFGDWDSALAAMADIAASGVHPMLTRVSDPAETRFSFATRKGGGRRGAVESAAMRTYLRRVKGVDPDGVCLSFVGYEGDRAEVRRQRRAVGAIVSAHGGLCVGRGPGELYDQKKFDTPYIRDALLDHGCIADVSETAASWGDLRAVYDAAVGAANRAFVDLGVPGWIMCHLSHSYHSGACLYFTFAFPPSPDADPLDEYAVVKRAVQQSFIDSGATLSHHHAVGLAHRPWLAADISEAGVEMVRALFDGVDPHHQLNPGKIVST